MAFSLAASAVSLARSVAVSAKVLDGVSPTETQSTALNETRRHSRAQDEEVKVKLMYKNKTGRF